MKCVQLSERMHLDILNQQKMLSRKKLATAGSVARFRAIAFNPFGVTLCGSEDPNVSSRWWVDGSMAARIVIASIVDLFNIKPSFLIYLLHALILFSYSLPQVHCINDSST